MNGQDEIPLSQSESGIKQESFENLRDAPVPESEVNASSSSQQSRVMIPIIVGALLVTTLLSLVASKYIKRQRALKRVYLEYHVDTAEHCQNDQTQSNPCSTPPRKLSQPTVILMEDAIMGSEKEGRVFMTKNMLHSANHSTASRGQVSPC